MTFLLAALCFLAQASDADRNEAALKKFGESRTLLLSANAWQPNQRLLGMDARRAYLPCSVCGPPP